MRPFSRGPRHFYVVARSGFGERTDVRLLGLSLGPPRTELDCSDS
jgi:hypothetical protein